MLDPRTMAEHESPSDDISTLWGPEVEGVLTPAPPKPTPSEDPRPVETVVRGNGHTNGNATRMTVAEQDTREDIARLVDALAKNHGDVVHRTDLDAARAQLEGAFTHQIAVALYELLAASNARFASAEDHINQRVTEAVEVHTRQLQAVLDKHHRSTTELSEFIWAELDAVRQRMNGPIDGLVSFQRELRHEVGRLGDLVAAQTAEFARKAEDDNERNVASGVGDLATNLATVRDDVAALREEIAELRRGLDGMGERQRRSRRWSRTS